MEWLVLVVCAAIVAAIIGAPWRRAGVAPFEDVVAAGLAEEHRVLLAELRELDDDTASGRISADERREGRRALAPRLRAVTGALRDAGLDPRGGA